MAFFHNFSVKLQFHAAFMYRMKQLRGKFMQTFRSKKDWWVLAFVICMSGLLIQLLLTMYAKGTMPAFPVHTGVYIITIFVLWWPIFNTRYQVDAERLQIRCMFLKWDIPRANIQKISKTNNSVASPALSLKRLKIDYVQAGQSKFVLVSPKDQAKFSQALGIEITD